MGSLEKLNNNFQNIKEEEKPKETNINQAKGVQIIEGLIQDINKAEESLPEGITKKMVDLYLGSDGKWHWHLKPEYIQNEEKRREYKEARDKWPL